MWAEKLPSGKYKFCERYTDPVTGQSRRISVTMDKNTAQSRKLASEILRQKMDMACPSALKLSELIALYNAEQAETVKRSTATRNAGILDRAMRVLGDVRLDKFTPDISVVNLLTAGRATPRSTNIWCGLSR